MKILEINIYPIKSLGGISLPQATVEMRGLENDRRWMLVDEKNKFLTQREIPKMAALKVGINELNLTVTDLTGESREIPLVPSGNEMARVKIWSSFCRAQVYDETVNRWFSEALQTNCRLVKMPAEVRRKVSYFYAVNKDDHVSFADGYPVLLIGAGSLADLNERLQTPVPMNRFRPNLTIENIEPFAEDSWKKISLGGTVFHVVKPCARCVMTTIEQESGEKQGVEPLKTLAEYRIPPRSRKRKILFGQNLIAEKAGGIIKIGDKLKVLETKN